MGFREIITIVLVLIFLVVVLDLFGRIFQKLSPKALRYIDYGSFAAAAVTGLLLYFGKAGELVRYIFFASIIIYFISLRHTAHKKTTPQD